MKFLADENVDKPIVKRLRDDGHTVLYVLEMERRGGCDSSSRACRCANSEFHGDHTRRGSDQKTTFLVEAFIPRRLTACLRKD